MRKLQWADPSWEADERLAGRVIFQYRFKKIPLQHPALVLLSSFHRLTKRYYEIHFDFMSPTTPGFPKKCFLYYHIWDLYRNTAKPGYNDIGLWV